MSESKQERKEHRKCRTKGDHKLSIDFEYKKHKHVKRSNPTIGTE
jgi:hypothetical protein